MFFCFWGGEGGGSRCIVAGAKTIVTLWISSRVSLWTHLTWVSLNSLLTKNVQTPSQLIIISSFLEDAAGKVTILSLLRHTCLLWKPGRTPYHRTKAFSRIDFAGGAVPYKRASSAFSPIELISSSTNTRELTGACHYLTNRFQMEAPVAPSRSLREASVGMAEAFSAREVFMKRSWRRREPFAEAPGRAHCVNASWRHREGFTKPSRRLREDTPPSWFQKVFATAPWRLRGAAAVSQRGVAFATAPRRLRGAVAATSLRRLHEPFIRSLRGPSRWVPRKTRNPFEPRRTIFTARGSCGGWTQNATFRPLLLRRPPKKPIFGFGRQKTAVFRSA